jgi:hypothetical protein
MVQERRGVRQDMAGRLPQSFLTTQKNTYNGIRLKQSWQHSQQASQLEQQLAG